MTRILEQLLSNGKCVHCGAETRLYCEHCYQQLVAENMRLKTLIDSWQEKYKELAEKERKTYIEKAKIGDEISGLRQDLKTYSKDKQKKEVIKEQIKLLQKLLKENAHENNK